MAAPDLFDRLYDAHAPALYAFLLNLTRHEEDTRDLLQDIFLKMAREPSLLAGVRNERAFLLRIARNGVVDLARRRQAYSRKQESLAAEVEPFFVHSPDPDTQALREALSAALAELPLEQREVVHLKLWEDLTFEEIASLLGIPLNTAASRYRYALDKMRDRLRLFYDEFT
jgi:RNA polymerase sigma-70 factor, ECF subfamily